MTDPTVKPVPSDEAKKHLRPQFNGPWTFQSDKYPWCQPGFVPLKLTDARAQDLLWLYAARRWPVDVGFAEALRIALTEHGYEPKTILFGPARELLEALKFCASVIEANHPVELSEKVALSKAYAAIALTEPEAAA